MPIVFILILHFLPSTGAIVVARALDYEICRDYFLTLEACDGGSPPLSAITTVNINLTDVNDNAPMFSCNLYSAVVSEDAAIGESVIQVGFSQIYPCTQVKVWKWSKIL